MAGANHQRTISIVFGHMQCLFGDGSNVNLTVGMTSDGSNDEVYLWESLPSRIAYAYEDDDIDRVCLQRLESSSKAHLE